MMQNKDRMLVRIAKEICAEKEIRYDSFSYGWITRLEKDGNQGYIFGYNFGINSSAASALCNDKSAASEILTHRGIPAVEHFLYMSPGDIKYVGENGNWIRLIKLLETYNVLVCKPNDGTGGNSVYLVRNQFELEEAAHRIFQSSRAMAVCPYYEIEEEYRVIVLGGGVKLVYAKKIPFIEGDGLATVKELLIAYMKENDCVTENRFDNEQLETVLEKGRRLSLNWKHNLGQGASPLIIEDGTVTESLSELAVKAAGCLGICFASVDIAQTKHGLKVLEVNSGVMMENFSQLSEENYMTAKKIYSEVIDLMLR